MKIYLLRPNPDNDAAWKPWYDKAFGFVVRAESEEQARLFASEKGGEENEFGKPSPWLDPRQSTCEEVTADGEAGLIIHDIARA